MCIYKFNSKIKERNLCDLIYAMVIKKKIFQKLIFFCDGQYSLSIKINSFMLVTIGTWRVNFNKNFYFFYFYIFFLLISLPCLILTLFSDFKWPTRLVEIIKILQKTPTKASCCLQRPRHRHRHCPLRLRWRRPRVKQQNRA